MVMKYVPPSKPKRKSRKKVDPKTGEKSLVYLKMWGRDDLTHRRIRTLPGTRGFTPRS